MNVFHLDTKTILQSIYIIWFWVYFFFYALSLPLSIFWLIWKSFVILQHVKYAYSLIGANYNNFFLIKICILHVLFSIQAKLHCISIYDCIFQLCFFFGLPLVLSQNVNFKIQMVFKIVLIMIAMRYLHGISCILLIEFAKKFVYGWSA